MLRRKNGGSSLGDYAGPEINRAFTRALFGLHLPIFEEHGSRFLALGTARNASILRSIAGLCSPMLHRKKHRPFILTSGVIRRKSLANEHSFLLDAMPKLDEDTQRARRENILNAAERCFSGQGFHSTSMQDICREAGISPGALYIYFNSKEELIAALCERERQAFARALTALSEAPDFMEALRQLGDAYCLDQPHHKFCFHTEMQAEALRNPAIGATVRETDRFIVEHFTRIITEARDSGRIDPSVNPGTLAQILHLFGDGIYLRRALDPDFNVQQCMDIILALLGSLIRPVDAGGDHQTNAAGGENETGF